MRIKATSNRQQPTPFLMTQSLIEGVIDMLNLFPSKNAISDTMGPAMLVEGKQKIDFGKKQI